MSEPSAQREVGWYPVPERPDLHILWDGSKWAGYRDAGPPQQTGIAHTETGYQPGMQLPLASWGERVGATILDAVIWLVPSLIVASILRAISESLGTVAGLLMLAFFLYFQYLNGSCGQSPGKALTGLKVVKANNPNETIGGAIGVLRYIVSAVISVFTCGLGGLLDVLWPLWDTNRQTLHDKAVGSLVLSGQPRREFGEILKP